MTLKDKVSIIHSMEEKSNNLRFCRKCLTRELADGGEIYRTLQEHIENLDPEVRAADELYDERLSICRDCELLLQGMCRSCGCYVELRAAVRKNGCPEKKWQGYKDGETGIS